MFMKKRFCSRTDVMSWLQCLFHGDGLLILLYGKFQNIFPYRHILHCGAVRSAASSYAAMRTVAGSRPVLVIVWEWHIGLALLCGCSGALEYPTTNSCGPINKSLSFLNSLWHAKGKLWKDIDERTPKESSWRGQKWGNDYFYSFNQICWISNVYVPIS